MKPIYKTVKSCEPHCPQCGKRLWGNNSFAQPYVCDCGTWEAKSWLEPWEFIIKTHKVNIPFTYR